jgi:hypothetical protein
VNEGFGECIEMQDDYWEKMELLNVLLECGDVLPLEEVRSYLGRFTGKMVSPLPSEKENLKEFSKNDEVVVFNLKDFQKYVLGKDLLHDAIRSIRPDTKD